MRPFLFGQLVRAILQQPGLGFLIGESGLHVGRIAGLKLLNGYLVVIGELELIGELDGLIDGGLALDGSTLHLAGPGLDGFLELGVLALVLVELHALLGLDEGSDELTVGLAHFLNVIER
jgi:hypothetical protein